VDYAVLTAFRQAHPTFAVALNNDSWEELPADLHQLKQPVPNEYTSWYLRCVCFTLARRCLFRKSVKE